ncbi:MAG: MotA/TolQ/ExbB proton channel family protein [Candidatus Competibacteraceae bacterium]|nr:MotA/TolQ/ExbB proton channel family protein [Candidatus Competibacteraceae bacterium]
MLELFKAGGLLMLPILACSIIALTIVAERFWVLRPGRVLPKPLILALRRWSEGGQVETGNLDTLARGSPLGRIIATGLFNRTRERQVIKESVEDTGRHVVHELERYLNTLGTIAAITPLLGLLGTVVGMIEVFATISQQGAGDAQVLAGGISKALITTAAGLTVAIPTLLFYRYFRGRVDALVVRMEQETLLLVDLLHGNEGRP